MRLFPLRGYVLIIAFILPVLPILTGPALGGSVPDVCTDANTWTPETAKGIGGNLEVTETICLDRGKSGTYNYGFVNIYSRDGKTEGKLIFKDAGIDFWAKSILVENGGSLIAGSADKPIANRITIHLYGDEKDAGIACKTSISGNSCGVSNDNWIDNPKKKMGLPSANGVKAPADYFYKYGNLPTYNDKTDGDYYFGRKVLALSYGGTIRMFGKKGATYENLISQKGDPTRTIAFSAAMAKGEDHFNLDRFVDWKKGRKVMFRHSASGHYEVRTIREVTQDPKDFHASLVLEEGLTSDLGEGGQIILLDNSGTSWARLDGSIPAANAKKTLKLDRNVDWQVGDQIVVTTTDYLPGHSELLTIDTIKDNQITVREEIKYPHNGEKYSLASVPQRLKDDGFSLAEAETRAAVALLSRNIRIVSEKCATYDSGLCKGMPEEAGTYYGGHTIVRQGFRQYQVQGVEFYQMGQGGRMSHTPVNFHLVRQAPSDTFVKDCSINESMTHWVEIRGTQNITLERNVGWKSIGHGYLLADGSEANNVLRGNIGVYARAGVGSYDDQGRLTTVRDNPRMVPGVLGKTNQLITSSFRHPQYTQHKYCPDIAETMQFSSDYIHPSVFFIMNGYNAFEYNMAAGAGTCGSCFWLAPTNVSGPSLKQVWEGYANIQKKTLNEGGGVLKNIPGTAPLKSFKGNYCSTAMHSFVTVGNTGVCGGVSTCSADGNPDTNIKNEDIAKLIPIANPFADQYTTEDYPEVLSTSFYQPVRCKKGESGCLDSEGLNGYSSCIKGDSQDCMLTVIDSYTSSYHWANLNFGAIWLRKNWFLVTDSFLSDVLQGGLTMVSGGSYDQVINGYWALTRRSAFVGNTQKWDTTQDPPAGNAFATNAGPFNIYSKLLCDDVLDPKDNSHVTPAAYCLSRSEGISMPTDNFANYQRLYNIYDGPVYQETNAFLDIKKTPVNCANSPKGLCFKSPYMFGGELNRGAGIPRAKEYPFKGQCVLPNAAIGWKQPNGFYYPPAFHSKNLFFNNVDLRHYIVVPLFNPGTMDVNTDQVQAEYCTYDSGAPQNLFASDYTDVDRQTELNDDDGSLAGLTGSTQSRIPGGGTISVNRDKFFNVPGETMECLSEQSCFQVPYDYVSAVVFPDAVPSKKGMRTEDYCPANAWCDDCMDRKCFGVPLFRQLLKSGETKSEEQSIRMMGAGIFQRSTLVANNGIYYIDTLTSKEAQTKNGRWKASVFEKNKAYNVFLLYAKPSTRLTFQLYVGPGFDIEKDVSLVRAGSESAVDSDFDGKKNIVLVAQTDQVKPMTFTRAKDWPPDWIRSYKDGVLTVIMDMSLFADDFKKAAKESCRPSTFCEWKDDPNPANENGGSCVYTTNAENQKILSYKGDNRICNWSIQAKECPSGGCLGFQVKLADGFVANNESRRPDPVTYANVNQFYTGLKKDLKWSYDTDWRIDWRYADASLSGDANSKITEYTKDFKIDTVDNGGNASVITLTEAVENNQYTIVRKLDGSGTPIDWAWIDRTQKLPASDPRQLKLDRKVSWQANDKVQVSTASACVYKPGNPPPPLPEDLWKKKQ